ncbi:MAG: CHAT domain-containing protein [Croceivirga sp.]
MTNHIKASCVLPFLVILTTWPFYAQKKEIPQKTISEINQLARAYHDAKEHQKLDSICTGYLHYVERSKEEKPTEIAEFYYYYGQAQYQFGYDSQSADKRKYFEKSLSLCRMAIKTIKKIEALELNGKLHYLKALVESGLSMKTSEETMLKATDLFSNMKKPNVDFLTNAYSFLARSMIFRGEMDGAMRYFRLGEKVVDRLIDQKGAKASSKLLSSKASLLYDKTYLIYYYGKTTKDSANLIETVNALRLLHKSFKNKEREGIYLSTALNHVGDWLVSTEENNTSPENKRLKLGLKYINESIDLVVNKGYRGSYYQFTYNKCRALNYSNKFPEALHLINHLLDTLPRQDGRKPFVNAQKGLIQSKMENIDGALESYYKAVASINSENKGLTRDFGKFIPTESYNKIRLLTRIAQKIERYFPKEGYQNIIANLYYAAFLQYKKSYLGKEITTRSSDQLRAIGKGVLTYLQFIPSLDVLAFFEQLEIIQNSDIPSMTSSKIDGRERTFEDSLLQRNFELHSQLVNAKIDKNEIEIDSLNNLIDRYERYLKGRHIEGKSVSSNRFSLESFQNSLLPKELALKFYFVKDHLAVFSISKDDFEWKMIPWTTLEKDLLKEFNFDLKQGKYSFGKAEQLASLLLPSNYDEFESIIVFPDKQLAKLPFEILTVKGHYLIETTQLHYTSALSLMRSRPLKINKETTVAIYAPEYPKVEVELKTRSEPYFLEGAQAEALAINKLFPSELFTNKYLKKAFFLETAQNASILHLAMHAVVNNEDPSLSHLLFGDGTSSDQNLYLEELNAFALNTDLVVLSACNTGLGKEEAAGGIASLQKAFARAGASATVASLWEVPDQSTRFIMESFYRNLKKGLSKSNALQQAKLEYLDSAVHEKLKSPYYWAGFVLYGDDTHFDFATIWYKKPWFLCAMAVSLVAFLSMVYFRKLKLGQPY